MTRLKEINQYISREHLNLLKSINRPRSLQGVTEKTEILKDLFIEYKLILNKYANRIPPLEWNREIEAYQALKTKYNECMNILENTQIATTSRKYSLKSVAKTIIICKRLSGDKYSWDYSPTVSITSNPNPSNTRLFKSVVNAIIFCQKLSGSVKPWQNTPTVSITSTQNTQIITMPDPAPFDVKSATAIVQPYDGSHDALNTFVDSANLLKELTTAEHVPIAIRFLKTRLTGKARLGLPDALATIDELINDVKNRCKGTVTSETIVAKLKTTKQRGDTEKFCNTVESLCHQLQATYVEAGVPTAVAKQMATKAGVDALTSGVTNNEARLILKASTFTDINQAIQKVTENATTNNIDTQVLAFNSNPRHNERNSFSPSFSQNRGYQNHYGHRDNYRSQDQRQSQPQHRNNFNRNYTRKGSQQPRPQSNQPQYNNPPQRFYNGYNSNRFQRGRSNFPSRTIYTTSAEQAQPLQASMSFDTPTSMAVVQNHHQRLTMPPGGPVMQPGGSTQNNTFLGHQGQYTGPPNHYIQ